MVKKQKLNTPPPEIEVFYKKLIYELNVKQTELELQNESLRDANVTAEVALKRYTMLFDLAAMGYFLLEPDGTICELNFTGADMLLEKRIALKGSNFRLFISDESKTEFNDFFKRTYFINKQRI